MKQIVYFFIIIVLCSSSFYLGYQYGSEDLNKYRKDALENLGGNELSDTSSIELDTMLSHVQIIHKKKDANEKENSENVIPNEKVAVSVFLPIVKNIYGSKLITSEMPFIVNLEDDSIWTIAGSSHNKVGGVVHVRMLSKNGEIIEMYHDK